MEQTKLKNGRIEQIREQLFLTKRILYGIIFKRNFSIIRAKNI